MHSQLPSVYTHELPEAKCQALYQHVYDSYVGASVSVYEEVGISSLKP
jgi:hypothetical protein